MTVQNVQDSLQVSFLFSALLAFVVLAELHVVEVDGRRHVQRLLRYSLQESILDHNFQLFALTVIDRKLRDCHKQSLEMIVDLFVVCEQGIFVTLVRLFFLLHQNILQLLLLLLQWLICALDSPKFIWLHLRQISYFSLPSHRYHPWCVFFF